MKFGRLTPIENLGHGNWLYLCDCGSKKRIYKANVVSGKTKSCGCFGREVAGDGSRTHGMSKTPIYQTWNRMRSRCTNPIVDRYQHYGGRGIVVCERWTLFENFYADMGDIPSKKHSIGRIDNDGNYEPSNCRWETVEEQSYNKSTTLYIELDGERIAFCAAIKETSLDRDTVYQRLRVGMTGERLFSKSNLNQKPITIDGVTKLTTEWMKYAKIPISSFYLFRRKGMTPEQVVRHYRAKLKELRANA